MKQERYEIQAGLFVIAGLLVLAGVIWLLGKERQVFTTKLPYHVYFTDVKGLAKGAPVRLGGITVGQVHDIGFTPSLEDPRIKVTLMLNEGSLDRIREDSVATLETQGLLGDQYVTIEPGIKGKQIMASGVIQSREGGNITETITQAADIVDNARKATETLNQAVTEFRQTTMKNLETGSASIATIAREIETGDGLLHNLIFPDKDKQKKGDDLESIVKRVDAILREIQDGNGLLHTLIYTADGDQTVRALRKAAVGLGDSAGAVSALLNDLKSGNGMLHALIYEEAPEGFESVMVRLSQTAANLEKASHAMASGSGTLGALLIDPALYENLVEVTDGAKRSFLLRQAIRSSLNR